MDNYRFIKNAMRSTTALVIMTMLLFALVANAIVIPLIPAAPVYALDSGLVSPSSDTGAFSSPTDAYADDTNYASISAGSYVHQYYGYNFSAIPSGSTITGIAVRMDSWTKNYKKNGLVNVELSWDSGTSWTVTDYSTGYLSETEMSYVQGSDADTWGHNWTQAELANFRVRLTSTVDSGGANYLDWIAVIIYYTLPPSIDITAPDDISDWDLDPTLGENTNIGTLSVDVNPYSTSWSVTAKDTDAATGGYMTEWSGSAYGTAKLENPMRVQGPAVEVVLPNSAGIDIATGEGDYPAINITFKQTVSWDDELGDYQIVVTFIGTVN